MRLLLVRTSLAGIGLLAFMWAAQAGAQTAKSPLAAKSDRLALVIGNAAYKDSPLLNPVNDAQDMAALLRRNGFEVILRENVSLKDMHLALREFGDRLTRDKLGVFFFAGHGVQVRGRNFLIPVDADIAREDEVAFSAMDIQAVLEKMDSARNHTNLVMLDACRNNPFASRFRLANAGLAQIDAPPGSVIAFATAPGSVAEDGDGRNGLYTKHLLTHLGKEGERIEDAFKQVRAAVRKDTAGRQVPWESTSLEGDVILKPAPVRLAPAKPATSALPRQANTPRAIDQPGAPPIFAVGDQWEWRLTDHLRKNTRSVKREVANIRGGEVEFKDERVTDLNGNILRQRQGDGLRTYAPNSMFFIFPMTPGISFTGKVVDTRGDSVSDQGVSLKVVGEEDITTAAGKFRAVRVEREIQWTVRGSGSKGVARVTYWYSSQVKNFILYEWSNMTAAGRPLNQETMELVSYTVQ
ncbi:MAG: caspase family protein [Betaproteobacteria bacterium]|nr:caspase family protein [Betaproteobacteria bacterium]